MSLTRILKEEIENIPNLGDELQVPRKTNINIPATIRRIKGGGFPIITGQVVYKSGYNGRSDWLIINKIEETAAGHIVYAEIGKGYGKHAKDGKKVKFDAKYLKDVKF